MSRLIIHVGTHKTGTTALQAFLSANRAPLDAMGVHYPDATRFGLGKLGEIHHGVAAALARGEGPFPGPLLRFRDHLRERLAGGAAVVLSSEAFYRHILPEGDEPEDEAALWSLREAYLDRMAAYFAPLDPTISIYFRNPVALAESKYANRTVATALRDDFPGFRRRTAWSYDYGRHLATLGARFPRVLAHSYEKSSRPSLIRNFFADHGLPEPPPAGDRRLRVALPNRAVLWIQRLKAEGRLADRKELRRRWHFALREEAQPLFAEAARSTFWESAEARQAFFDRYGAPVAGIAFAAPAADREGPRTTWDDGLHAAANAAYAAWLPANETRLRRREAAGIEPYDDVEATPAAAPPGGGLRRLLRRIGGS
ncbi:hypothetical protein [Amaricoccus sp.]|uniref:hypothetical protein n=1 Tax=Amaricoccus sp. TaxID=1872485 RepID=UPI001B4B0A12|nr:hypothetical protein [Amaricoccus sp.]MBP7002997.1 hypothetical protein [Amaricoccus sp.]